MPIDYSKYPKNWKPEIRPAILTRAKNKCEVCGIKNGLVVLRGIYNGIEVYQDEDGNIFDASNSKPIGSDYLGEVDQTLKNKLVKVVLTISHEDHDISNNDYSNLKALCQLHHLRHDKEHHMKNSRATNEKKKGLQKLF